MLSGPVKRVGSDGPDLGLSYGPCGILLYNLSYADNSLGPSYSLFTGPTRISGPFICLSFCLGPSCSLFAGPVRISGPYFGLCSGPS